MAGLISIFSAVAELRTFLHTHRFDIFLSSQILILFGSLLFAPEVYEEIIHPILITVSIAAAINLISSNRTLMWFFIVLFLGAVYQFGSNFFFRSGSTDSILMRLSIYLMFSTTVTISLIKQVWRSDNVNKNVIMGLASGYISLGFVSFFLFMLIETVAPGSFKGTLLETSSLTVRADSIMYYAFITLLTIGYGEIVPITPMAQKAAIFTGLAGQFYLIIIMTVVLEKYIRHSIDRKQK